MVLVAGGPAQLLAGFPELYRHGVGAGGLGAEVCVDCDTLRLSGGDHGEGDCDGGLEKMHDGGGE